MVKIVARMRLFSGLIVLKVARSLAPIDGRTYNHGLRRQIPTVLSVRGGQGDDNNNASEEPDQLQAAGYNADQQPLEASWSSADNESRQAKADGGSTFIAFSEKGYKAMAEDPSRTPMFVQAIEERIAKHSGEMTVVDVGTGPYALLALVAARAGAKKVFAVEVNAAAAASAREAVARATDVPHGVVEVIEGFSTDITLPHKVDLFVGEVVGNMASEEGIVNTVRDAQSRHLLRPYDAASYIPTRVQTLAAPMSYALHHPALGPDNFNWGQLRKNRKNPPHVSSSYLAVRAMAAPQVVEDICLYSKDLPSPQQPSTSTHTYEITASCLDANKHATEQDLLRGGVSPEAAQSISSDVSRGLSALGCWPRLYLDPDQSIVVESRSAASGAPQFSHWQTVLPLLTDAPRMVQPGETCTVKFTVSHTGTTAEALVTYAIRAVLSVPDGDGKSSL